MRIPNMVESKRMLEGGKQEEGFAGGVNVEW